MKPEQKSFIRYIKTDKKNYVVNLVFSGLISIIVSYIVYFNSGMELGFLEFLVFTFLFYNCYRAGEYILTGKTISVERTFFLFGYEEKGKTARNSFVYYLLTAIIFTIVIIAFIIY